MPMEILSGVLFGVAILAVVIAHELDLRRGYRTVERLKQRAKEIDMLPGTIRWSDAALAHTYKSLTAEPTPEELWDEWCRDKWDFDMDLDRFVRKWRGRVPKKPLPVRDTRYSVRELCIDISEFMKKAQADAEAEGVDTELLVKLTEMRINAQANPERTRGYLFRGVDVTDLMHESGSTIQILRQCRARADSRRGSVDFGNPYLQVWKSVE